MNPITVTPKNKQTMITVREETVQEDAPKLNFIEQRLFLQEAAVCLDQALAQAGVIVPMPYIQRINQTLLEIGKLYYVRAQHKGLF